MMVRLPVLVVMQLVVWQACLMMALQLELLVDCYLVLSKVVIFLLIWKAKTNWNEIPLSSEADTTNVEIMGYNGYCEYG